MVGSWGRAGRRWVGVLATFGLVCACVPGRDLASRWSVGDGLVDADDAPKLPVESASPLPAEQPLALLRRCLSLLDRYYLLPEKLAPASLFRGAVARLAAVTDDGLFIPGEGGGPDTLLIGRRTLLLDGSSLKTPDELADALAGVATFYRQATLFNDLDTEELLEQVLIGGMLDTLDRPTRLLVDKGLENFEVRSRGSLIGVGMSLRLRDGRPEVMEVVDGGPAARGGCKVGDRILRIDGESTLDMPMKDVVGRLRGEANTVVTVEIERRGAELPIVTLLTRDKVEVENVRVARLDGDIGYLEITNFSDRTLANFRTKLTELTAEAPLKGFILDLRENRGGSLRQSALVADQLVESGLLVRTAGRNDEKVRGLVERIDATLEVGVPMEVPVAVLVGPSTASGAEILAGAIKYLDRGIIVGRTTFGKGTVQKVYKLAPEASLKETVARYLLEGDHWIQGVGIEPDVELDPVRIDDGGILFGGDRPVVEDDEEEDPFHGEAEPRAERRLQWVQRAEPAPEGVEEEVPEDMGVSAERLASLRADFEVRFAASLLREAGHPTRAATLKGVDPILARVAAEEEAKLVAELEGRGIDWAPAPSGTAPFVGELPLKVRLSGPSGAEGVLAPSLEDVPLTLTATWEGAAPMHRMRVTTVSADKQLHDRDFVLGRMERGQARSAAVPLRLPMGVIPGIREVALLVTADELPEPVLVRRHVEVVPVERPSLEVAVTYVEDGSRGSTGDGDHVVEPGERVALVVGVTNRGKVSTGELSVSLRNPLRKDVEIVEARVLVPPLEKGQAQEHVLSFLVHPLELDPPPPPVEVELEVRDKTFGEDLLHKLSFAPDHGAPPAWAEAGLVLSPPRVTLARVAPPGLVEDGVVDLQILASDDERIRVVSIYRDDVKVGRVLGEPGARGRKVSFQQTVQVEAGSQLLRVVAKDEAGLVGQQRIWTSAVVNPARADADGR